MSCEEPVDTYRILLPAYINTVSVNGILLMYCNQVSCVHMIIQSNFQLCEKAFF